jgi:hypothetical protein
MANRFSDLGFAVETKDDLHALLDAAIEAGEMSALDPQHYLCWTPGSGIEIWLSAEGNMLLGVAPHFGEAGTVTVGAVELSFADEAQLDGRLRAWMDPPTGDPTTGAYPFVCALVEGRAHREHLAQPTCVTLQLAAFAESLTCWPDDAAYAAATAESEAQFAPESVIPAGLFTTEPPSPEALVTGHVLAVERRVNPATGAAFYVLRLHTYGNLDLTLLADPALLATPPVIGGVAQAVCWLSGRIIEA